MWRLHGHLPPLLFIFHEADLFFSFTKCFKRYLLIAIMLVSEPEKKADINTKKAIDAKRIHRGISFNLRYPNQDFRCEKCVQEI